MTTQLDAIINLPNLYINGLIVSNDPVTPNTKLNISAGIARDINNIVDLAVGVNNANVEGGTVTAPLVINAAVVGANGVDTGTFAANKFYAVYLIGDSRCYKPTAGLMSLSSNAVPLMPFGYDSYRLIGYAVSDGSAHFYLMNQIGVSNSRKFIYQTPFDVGSTGGATYSGFTFSLSGNLAAPGITNQTILVYADYNATAAGNVLNATNDSTTTQFTSIAPVAGATAHTTVNFEIQPFLSSSPSIPTIYVKVTAGTVHFYVLGFNFYV